MSTANWWAKQLGTQPQIIQPRTENVPMPPSQQPMTPYIPPQPEINTTTTKAQSASQTRMCPDCGSNNYMAVSNAAPRCYDCGYPLSQSGSKFGSLTGAKVEGNIKSSLGNETQNNYNPQQIIGRID
jgi:ribosomal protein S27AE